MFLFLAFFWLVVGVMLQMFWTDLQQHMTIRLDRNFVSFVCFVLFSYNFIRWRMARMMRERAHAEEDKRALLRRHADKIIDPTFDFSDPKPEEPPKNSLPD